MMRILLPLAFCGFAFALIAPARGEPTSAWPPAFRYRKLSQCLPPRALFRLAQRCTKFLRKILSTTGALFVSFALLLILQGRNSSMILGILGPSNFLKRSQC